MIKLRQPSWPKQNSVGAPSVKKVPQGGFCISIKLVSWNGVPFTVTPFFLCCARWGAAGRLFPFPLGSVRAEYPIRTVIQLSGRLFVHLLINWEFFCYLNEVNFVNFPQRQKEPVHSTSNQREKISRHIFDETMYRLCYSETLNVCFFRSAGRHCNGTAQPQSLSAAALCFISDIQLWALLWE